MDMLQAVMLAFVQGLTEFLPISSSGHLILIPALLGWPDQGLGFDVAVHAGTLIAALLYFRTDIFAMLSGWIRDTASGRTTANSQLVWAIIAATFMIGLAGILLEKHIIQWLRNPLVIALATLIFGILLGVAQWLGRGERTMESVRWQDVLVIGFMQILALCPGTSRSGITITAGLLLGLTAEAATRLSFLLAIPVITLAGLRQTHALVISPQPVQWLVLIVAALVSGLVALACIHFLLRYVQRAGFLPFVIYRMILGVILLAVFL